MSLPRCPKTDLIRLECGCPEHNGWAFDYDDLTPEEHAYLEGRRSVAPIPAVHPVRPLGSYEPKPLPAYDSGTWTTAENTPGAAGGRTCDACGDRPAGDAFVCSDCCDDLRVCLGDVPGLLDDLAVMLTRQARVSSRPAERTRVEHTRWDHLLDEDSSGIPAGRQLASAGYNRPAYDPRASIVWAELENEVGTAVRILCEPRGIPIPVSEAREGSRWLLLHLATIPLDPAGPDIVHGMKRVHEKAMAVIDNVAEGVYIGVCDNPDCRAPMHADRDKPEHRCNRCGATYLVAERVEAQRDRVRESLLSLSEIETYSTADKRTFGAKLTGRQLTRWVESGQLVRVGWHPDRAYEPTYRAGDVVALVDRLHERQTLPLGEVADLLSIPVKTLYRWQSEGIIKPVPDAEGRGRMYDLAEVREASRSAVRDYRGRASA